jgi:KDO2-lipid IV(A) lauroyltransferase
MGQPVTAVALPHPEARLDWLFNRQRQRSGVGVIPLGPKAARRCLEALRRGQVLGLLADREFGRNGVEVQVWGRTLLLPRGPATLSLRTGAPVVPTFLLREGPWRFRLCCEPPIWPPAHAGRPEQAVRALTHAYAAAWSRYVERVPEQWLMFHPVTSLS